jgi:hypothetical protein
MNTQRSVLAAEASEAEGERLPHPTHCREMKPPGRSTGEVIEVDPSGSTQDVQRQIGLAGPC